MRCGMLIVICLLLFVIILIPSSRGESVDITLDQELVWADFTLDREVKKIMASFSGNVSYKNSYDDLRLRVDSGEFESSITPENIKMHGSGAIHFDGTIIVPENAVQNIYTITVIGELEKSPDVVYFYTATLSLKVVHNRVKIEGDTTLEFDAGSRATYTFKIFNEGSTSDNFSVELVEETELAEKGWAFVLNKNSLEIQSNNFRFIYLIVNAPSNATAGNYSFTLRISSESDSYSYSEYSFNALIITKEAKMSEEVNLDLILIIGAIAFIAFLGFYITGTEIGFYSFLMYILLPLYTRIKRGRVLDQFTRGQIYGYIKANPGANYMTILQDLELHNGVLAYHLKVLEREGLIKSQKDMLYRRFYPAEMKIPKKRFHLSRIQKDILSKIQEFPGITQAELRKVLGESKQVINYHIKILEEAKIIKVQRTAKSSQCYLNIPRDSYLNDVIDYPACPTTSEP